MGQDSIIQYITETFADIAVLRPTDGPGAGDSFIYHDPLHNLDPTHQWPFATIVTKDYGDFDNTSHLDRPDVFRLNIGVSHDTFHTIVSAPYASYDYAALDRVMPHPVYAAQSWVCVLNPSRETFESVKPLLADAYARVATRHARRQATPD